jgi:hypothetical protein
LSSKPFGAVPYHRISWINKGPMRSTIPPIAAARVTDH